MLKQRLYITIIALLIGVTFPLFAQTGGSCSNPIRLGQNYSATITGAGTIWYVANTFDLPLTVQFYPNDNTAAAPTIEMDFGCTPGVYDDSIVCHLFCYANGSYVTLPHRVTPDMKTNAQGVAYYEVAMGEFYRDMLLSAGISYNIDVFVKVQYTCAGTINLTPDAEFSQCMETDQWLLYDRALPVAANDEETFFIAPYANWQYKNIRYIWSGSQSATVVLGTTCDFSPMDVLDERRVAVMQMAAGGDTTLHTYEDIAYYMTYMRNPTNTAKGGIFYVKVVSGGTGSLKVELIKEIPPEGGATLLQYDVPTPVSGDTATLYAIPKAWTSATRFNTPTDHLFKMYIGLTPDFLTKDAVGVYPFSVTEQGHWCGLTKAELDALWLQTSKKYLYLRFQCTQSTTITPTQWTPSDCIGKTRIIRRDTVLSVAARSKVIHRFYYNDWVGGDMTVQWSRTSTMKMLVSGGCTIGTSETGSELFYSHNLTGSAYTIPDSTIAQWADHVDTDGYFYVRFYTSTTSSGTITISTNAPKETDPPEPVPEIPHTTVYLTCLEDGAGVQIMVSTAQTIRINDANGNELWQQTVQPGQPQDIPLQSGIYMLIGENEHIEIHL